MMVARGDECPILLARCEATRDWTLGQFADRACEFVADFVRLHPMFAEILLAGKSAKDSPPLLSDLSNLRPWIMERSWDRSPPSPYTDLDAAGNPTAASTGSVGFTLSLTNNKGWADKVDLSVRGVGSTLSTTATLKLGQEKHPEFSIGPLPLMLVALMCRHWPVRYASYALDAWHEKVNFRLPPSERKGPIEVGWLTYVADRGVARWLPPEVHAEPLGSGVVFRLTPHISRFDDEDDVTLGLAVKAALDASGLYGFV